MSNIFFEQFEEELEKVSGIPGKERLARGLATRFEPLGRSLFSTAAKSDPEAVVSRLSSGKLNLKRGSFHYTTPSKKEVQYFSGGEQ